MYSLNERIIVDQSVYCLEGQRITQDIQRARRCGLSVLDVEFRGTEQYGRYRVSEKVMKLRGRRIDFLCYHFKESKRRQFTDIDDRLHYVKGILTAKAGLS